MDGSVQSSLVAENGWCDPHRGWVPPWSSIPRLVYQPNSTLHQPISTAFNLQCYQQPLFHSSKGEMG